MDLENGTIVFLIIIAVGAVCMAMQWWDNRTGVDPDDRFGGE